MTERVASLDLLRGLAAFSVAVPHFLMAAQLAPVAAETISILGVEVFFVLSGYVLAPQIITFLIDRPTGRNLMIFWLRRWMRTIPPYLIALVAASVLSPQLLTSDFLRYAFYVQNVTGQANTLDYFPIAWSLSVEEWFYILFPLACFGLVPILPEGQARPWIIGATFVAAITLFRTLAPATDHWGNDIRRVVLFRMDAIGYGFLLHLALERVRLRPFLAWLALIVTTLLALVLTQRLANVGTDHTIETAFPFYIGSLGAAAIAAFLTLDLQGRAAAAALFLGRISYSVYLFHFIALGPVLGLALPWPVSIAAFVAITAVIAILVSIAIETPVLAARPRYATSPTHRTYRAAKEPT